MEHLRPLLTTYAYNILGTIDEAQDVVQDAFYQFMKVDQAGIINEKAYLIRTVINLSINQKNRQKKFLKDYPGVWLPEPVSDENPDLRINRKEILSYSLMVLLEKLSAQQRAVFILREAFDYDHTEIARALGIQPEYSRQLLSRARKKLENLSGVTENDQEEHLKKYLEVIASGDTVRLEELLNEDIMVVSDGGGKARAGLHPVFGKKSAMAMISGLYHKFYHKMVMIKTSINQQPALLFFEDNKLSTCQIIQFEKGKVKRVFFMRNPDKLKLIIPAV